MKDELISRTIREPLCGWQWVYQHYHDLDGFHPTIEITRPGSRYTIQTHDTTALNRAIKEITKEG